MSQKDDEEKLPMMKTEDDLHPFLELMEVAGSIYDDFDLSKERSSQLWTCDKVLGKAHKGAVNILT